MNITEYYPAIKNLHVVCVTLSGALFASRGILMSLRSSLANLSPLRYASYINDTILLAAGITLVVLSRQYPGVHQWLTLKLALLPIYILLGVFALRRGSTYNKRIACFVAAVGVYLLMFFIARTHQPAGLL